MGARAEAVEHTRARIVSAAVDLHTEKGLLATSFDEIADDAGVSTATVYRQFPSLAELVPACARTVFDLIQPLTEEQAATNFGTLRTAAARFELLVHANAHCYGAGAGWLHAAHRERDFVPELDAALRVIEDSLRVLVAVAAGRRLSRADQAALFVLNDFPLWWSLVQELGAPAAERTLVRLVATEVARIGLDHNTKEK